MTLGAKLHHHNHHAWRATADCHVSPVSHAITHTVLFHMPSHTQSCFTCHHTHSPVSHAITHTVLFHMPSHTQSCFTCYHTHTHRVLFHMPSHTQSCFTCHYTHSPVSHAITHTVLSSYGLQNVILSNSHHHHHTSSAATTVQGKDKPAQHARKGHV